MALWLGRTLEDLNPFWHFGLGTAHWADPRLFWALVNLADVIHIGPNEKEQKIKEKHSFTGKFSALQNANVTHLAEIPHNVEKSDNNPMYVHFKYLMPCTMCH